jgi:hypothetical protein
MFVPIFPMAKLQKTRGVDVQAAKVHSGDSGKFFSYDGREHEW